MDHRQFPKIPFNQRPSGCQSCPFGGIRVGSRGPVDSPFVIVGESPGGTEVLLGYPFIGDSGDMVEDVLKACGLPEGVTPYVINAMQCMPREKNPQSMAEATKCCQERLLAELQVHPRKVILCMGNAASWAVTNNFGLKITQARGKRFDSPLAEMGVVVTVHPAFLMRNGVFFPKWKQDIQYAIDLLNGVDPKEGKWSPPTFTVAESEADVERIVTKLDAANFIAADTETGGTDSNGCATGLHFQRGHILCLTLCSDIDKGSHVDVIPGWLLWKCEPAIRRLMGNGASWIWQNGKFDVKWYRYEGISEARVDEDTMLLSYALNENKGHDLDTIAWEWVGAPQHKHMLDEFLKQWPKPKRDYAKIPTDMLYRYAAIDTSKTYRMFWPLRRAVQADPHLEKLYTKILIPASEALTQVEMKGLRLDPDRVRENDAYLLSQLVEPEKLIQGYAMEYMNHEINIASPIQLSRLLYDAMKLGPSGSSTDDDSLIKILRKFDHPIARYLQTWRKHSKARNTYVKAAFGDIKKGKLPWQGLDDRVHITYKLHGTSTGRLSSGDPTNLQNWPRDPQIRGAFIPDPGKVLIECDLNQAELRCLAIMSGDPTLLDIYTRNEVSIHHITSVAMFGEGYTDDQKMRAKAVNFGIVYGRSAPSLAEEFNISLSEAEDYIRIWLERYPVARDFIAESRAAPTQMRTMITNFGRKKRWGVISNDNQNASENEAANFPHQSTAHDITLLSLIETQPKVKKIWQADIVNEIHDAIYFEVEDNPEHYGPMVAYVQSVMQRIPKDWGLTRVPFLAEAKVGNRWGRSYMKGFEPTNDHKETAIKLLAAS